MWAATGRRYGLCEVTVQPCNPRPPAPLYRTYPLPSRYGGGVGYDPLNAAASRVSIVDGQWRNNSCGGGCRCTASCAVSLPGPVDSIIEVTVDGVLVEAAAYNVLDRHLLARLDGDCWPTCQRLGEIPGFQVTYLRGDPVPDAILAATATLRCQYAAACTGGECQLPARLVSLTRQGAEFVTEPALSEGGKIRTGIQDVDDAIAADNPYGLTCRPQVLSPDMPSQASTVTWAGGS